MNKLLFLGNLGAGEIFAIALVVLLLFGGRAAVPSASGRSAGSSAPAAGTVYFFS